MTNNEKVLAQFAARIQQLILQYKDIKKENAELYAMIEGQEEKIMELLEQASQLLENLSSDIYTPSLRQLKNASRDLKAVAKSSGAGGGDCGIALSFDQDSTTLLKKRWADLGIELLYQERIGHDDKSEG